VDGRPPAATTGLAGSLKYLGQGAMPAVAGIAPSSWLVKAQHPRLSLVPHK